MMAIPPNRIMLLEHDPEKHAPHAMRGGNRFSLATNAERVCAEIMLKERNPYRNQPFWNAAERPTAAGGRGAPVAAGGRGGAICRGGAPPKPKKSWKGD